MATVRIGENYAVDMGNANITILLYADDASYSNNHVTFNFSDGEDYIFYGDYNIVSGELDSGTITSIGDYYNKETVFEISGISYDLERFATLLLYGKSSLFFSELFSGADQFNGSSLGDKLYGYAGDDVMRGYGGSDTLLGGAGSDTASYIGAPGAVNIRLDQSYANDGYGASDTLTGFENAIGSAFNDFIIGTSDGNTLHGGDGADTIGGGLGADVLYGGGGGDWIEGSQDGDLIDGGDGRDVLLGGDSGDVLYGQADDDLLGGGDGDDMMIGGDGDDGLDGGAGNDTLSGGAGLDVIVGDGGNDYLTGGDGADTFVFASDASGTDVVADFTPGEDRLSFRQDAVAADLIATATFTDGGSVVLNYGVNSHVILSGVTRLDSSWFA